MSRLSAKTLNLCLNCSAHSSEQNRPCSLVSQSTGWPQIGHSAIMNEEQLDKNAVTAFIEVKVSPQVECGYDDIARAIARYDEVDTVQLMSGSFDLSVTLRGNNLREVALFVNERLATLDGVLSTTTHFILQRYKEKGVNFAADEADERSLVSP